VLISSPVSLDHLAVSLLGVSEVIYSQPGSAVAADAALTISRMEIWSVDSSDAKLISAMYTTVLCAFPSRSE
jgi:hypothetical protein